MLIKIFIFLSLNFILYFSFTVFSTTSNNFLNFYSQITLLLNDLVFNFFILFFLLNFFKKNQNINFKIFIFFYIYNMLNKKPNVFLDCVKYSKIYKEFSLDLFDGLVQFHPYVFYISLILLFTIFFSYSKNKKIKNANYNKILLKILLLSLFSGGYWSYNNLLWGNWWTWDNVELVLFFLILFYTLIIHKIKNINKTAALMLINFFSTLVTYIFLIRYSYYASKHNFFKIQSTSSNLSNIANVCLSFFVIDIFYFFKKNKKNKSKVNKLEFNNFVLLVVWFCAFNFFNYIYFITVELYIYILFFYFLFLLKSIIKNSLIYILHLIFLFVCFFLYYFKASNIKLNTQKYNKFEFFNYSQKSFVVQIYNFMINNNFYYFTFNKTKMNIYNNNPWLFNHIFIMFNYYDETTNNVINYNISKKQNLSYFNFFIKKNMTNNLNVYLNSQIQRTVCPIYFLFFLFFLFI